MNNQNKNSKWVVILCFICFAVVSIFNYARRMKEFSSEPAFEELELADIESITCILGCISIGQGAERELPEEQWEEFVNYLKKIKIYPYAKVEKTDIIHPLSIMNDEGAQIKITFKNKLTKRITIYEKMSEQMLIEIDTKCYFVEEIPYSSLMQIVKNIEEEAVLRTYKYLLEEVPELLQYQTILEYDNNADTELLINFLGPNFSGYTGFCVTETDAEGNEIDRGTFYVKNEFDGVEWSGKETKGFITLEEWRNSSEYISVE